MSEEELEIERSDRQIKPEDKLVDFARIKISSIDPNIIREVRGHLEKIRKNIDILKED